MSLNDIIRQLKLEYKDNYKAGPYIIYKFEELVKVSPNPTVRDIINTEWYVKTRLYNLVMSNDYIFNFLEEFNYTKIKVYTPTLKYK